MPEKRTIKRARATSAKARSPSTQAGEFVREEMDHIREGKHGARSTKQAIAIGLSKARRAGVKLPPPKKGPTSAKTRKAASAYAAGHGAGREEAPLGEAFARGHEALDREGHGAASKALSKHARAAARNELPRAVPRPRARPRGRGRAKR